MAYHIQRPSFKALIVALLRYSLFVFLLFALAHNSLGQSSPDISKLDDAVGVVICYDREGNQIGHGSCFIIDADGILVTNYHVLEDVYSAKIKLESGIYPMKEILAGDKDKDLIKFSIVKSYSTQQFPVVKIAQSISKKGDDAWAIGTPYSISLMNTVSKGLISNITYGSTRTIIQTNAEITNGSSGGALFNVKGEVIGVTSSGIKEASANLNFAIWVGELNNLSALKVERIYNDALIPVQASFYISYLSYSNDVSLYIDNRYIGTFSSYFASPKIPNCGQTGTITTYLSKGYHTFHAYEKSTQSRWNGSFTITSNDCFLKGLNNTPTQTSTSYKPQNSSPLILNPRSVKSEKYSYRWMPSVSLIPYYEMATYPNNYEYLNTPLSLYLERYFADYKWSTRINYQFFQMRQTYSDQSLVDCGRTYTSFGLDLKRLLKNKYSNWNWYLAGSMNYRSFVFDYSYPVFISNGIYQTSYVDSIISVPDITPMLKLGAELQLTKRWALSMDAATGYGLQSNLNITEYHVMIGYRIGKNFSKNK